MGNNVKLLLLFFGPPGSGKGTQADILGKKLGIPVISPGELFRHEMDEGTKIGKAVAEKMAKGILLSDDVVEGILEKRLAQGDIDNGFILDGYPRRQEQLAFFEKRIAGSIGTGMKILAIYVDVDDDVIGRRIGGRRVCDCGASYHVKNNPPKQEGICDLCGDKLYQRPDDQPEVLKARLIGFHERIKPLLGFFEKDHELVRVDGSKNIENIKKDIWDIIRERS